jgi:hypothetical protein
MSDTLLRAAKAILIACGLSALVAMPALAAYEHGPGALQIWDEQGLANSPAWIKVWLAFMALTMFSGVFFVWKHVEARWVVAGITTALLISKFVIPALSIVSLSGLVGLVHVIFWSPALFVLLKNRPFTKGLSAYAIWSGIVTCVIIFSLFFDIRDAAIYLQHMATR